MKKIKMIAGIILVISAAVSVSGCWPFPSQEKIGEKIMEKAIESGTGGKVDVNADKNEMTINSDQGSTTFSGGGTAKLPDNFPTDVFIYSDAKITYSVAGNGDDNSFSVVYGTSASPEDVFLKYKDEMVKNGWQKDTELDMGAQGKMVSFKRGDRRAGVTMGASQNSENAEQTMVTVTVTTDNSSQTNAPSESDGSGSTEIPKTE